MRLEVNVIPVKDILRILNLSQTYFPPQAEASPKAAPKRADLPKVEKFFRQKADPLRREPRMTQATPTSRRQAYGGARGEY